MAVTLGATESQTALAFSSYTDCDIDPHTVDADTDLLLVSIKLKANEFISGVPQWSLGGGENMTLVRQSTSNDNSQNLKVWVYGLLTPTAGLGAISIATTSAFPAGQADALNFIGVETSSLAAAVKFIDEDVVEAASTANTNPLNSGGDAGNALYVAAGFRGGDVTGASNASGFTENFDGRTGTDTGQDLGYYTATLLDNAPQAITVDWDGTVTDQCSAVYLEIVAAGGGGPAGGFPYHAIDQRRRDLRTLLTM